MFATYVAALPGAKSVILPTAGHMAAYENPTAFNAAVDGLFTEDTLARPRTRVPLRPLQHAVH